MVVSTIALGAGPAGAGEEVLPHGEARTALASPHFPDRLHEFVWRNWGAVESSRLARIVGGSTGDVVAMARSMGLPAAPAVPPEMRERGYITLIRRNWHLLPYAQLLDLVAMTPQRLAFTLREDDFLWEKLGRLKPRCEPLRYRAPDAAARRRAAEIRHVVAEEFGAALAAPAEPRFEFVRRLSQPFAAGAPPAGAAAGAPPGLRIVYSYLAVYGDPLANPRLDPYPDGLLERYAAAGVNGVWMQAVLRELAPGGPSFPEFGTGSERRLASLRTLARRAARHGIGVYLYLNEPRAMPESFFASRPELAGVREGPFVALCTSQPAVRAWLRAALTHVFSTVPELAGVFTISGSENLTNCASHQRWRDCPRCRARGDAEILAEVNAAIEAGVHGGNPAARVLVSDWGWRSHGESSDVIARLPKSVWLLSASEWALPIERGGIASKVGEYSLSAVGPGPRALRHWAAAREAGLGRAAEIQFNNTCEIASLPYLPVLDLVAEHLRNLAPVGLDGLLVGWTMGGYPSPNLELARRLMAQARPDVEGELDALGRQRFGAGGGPHARRAWRVFSDAFREYPFHVGVVYTTPVQIGPANPLYRAKTGYRATMWGIPYDDVDRWRGPYPAEVLAGQFEKVASGWRAGVAELRAAAAAAPAECRGEARADLRLARAAGIHFQSVANQTRYVLARDALAASPAPVGAERRRLETDVAALLRSEIALARELHGLVLEDSRLGFEPSCQYFYLPLDLVEKVINCRWLLQLHSGRVR